MRRVFTMIVLTIIFLVANSAISQDILVWKNVGSSEYVSPENGSLLTTDYEIRLALTVNLRNIIVVESLPEDLSAYTMIFITLGFAVDCG